MNCSHQATIQTDSSVPPAAPPCCFIAPPDMLDRLAKEGTPEQRDAALKTLATSAAIRAKRSLVGNIMRTMSVDAETLGCAPPQSGQRRTVYDMEQQGMSALPGRRIRGEGDAESPDTTVNLAYDGSDKVYDYFSDNHGRRSIDDADMELVSSVHYGVDYDNAFWDGTQMVYGDGSGRVFVVGGLTAAIDVIGHEMTHGITQNTAGLVYSKQAGALNESWSDVFGSLVKQYSLGQAAADADWLIGAGTLVPELGSALRSMKEPGTAFAGDNQPGHMDDYLELPDDNDPRNDNGGVHINSGIPNKAFYLAATALGGNAWEKAGRIWYVTLTDKLERESQFTDAAAATVEVAGDLFPDGDERSAVEQAWRDVGVIS